MGKQYKSVSEMVKHLTDEEFHKEFNREIVDKRLAKTLFAMRCSKGITQAEMASLLGCTQSRVSKLENSGTNAIKISDLVSYAQALKLNMSVSFHKELTSAEWVKFHTFQIKKHQGRGTGMMQVHDNKLDIDVDVRERGCIRYACYWPKLGRGTASWLCRTREARGCPSDVTVDKPART